MSDQSFSVTQDCEKLKKAIDGFLLGWGTDKGAIISILGNRNANQRKLIRETYAQTYKEDILKALDRELCGDFERIVVLWTMDPAERDAILVNEVIKKKSGSSHYVIMEIGCTRSSDELFLARRAYLNRFNRSMEEDVAAHTTGQFRKLLVPMLTAYRYEGGDVNMGLAKSEAKILHEKVSKKAYCDEELIGVLSTRGKAQINATLNNYNDQFGHSINKDLKSDPKDEFLTLLRATIKCLVCPEKYFEKVLRISIKGIGTDEESLTRVVVTRADVDIKRIKEEYHRRNSVTLEDAIKGDTSFDYAKMLLTLIGHEKSN